MFQMTSRPLKYSAISMRYFIVDTYLSEEVLFSPLEINTYKFVFFVNP